MNIIEKLNRVISGTLVLSMALMKFSSYSVLAVDNITGFRTESDQTTTTNISYGDPNGDEKIDAKDASFCLSEYSLLSTGASSLLSEAEKNAADVNRDEKIDSRDASDILSYYGYLSTGGLDSLADFLSISYPEGPEHIEGDGPFCLEASYDSESNKVSLGVLFSPSDSIVILESENTDEFSEMTTLSGTTRYSFTLDEDITTKYYKASGVDENGETVETPVIEITRDEDDIRIGYIDSDEDGLTDFTELLLGTDPKNKDKDLDGLTDWEEINLTGTDPLIRDTDEDDIPDGERDPDKDGLTNIEEIKHNCNPKLKDTDEDHLNDGDEILKYGTDPTEPDTDHDTLNDDYEIRYELDPMNDTTDGIKDTERKIEQIITSEYGQFYRVNSADNAYSLSLDIVASGDGNKEISVVTDTCNEAYKTDAQVGKMIDIKYSDSFTPDSATLKFRIRDDYIENTYGKYSDLEEFKGIKRLNVFKLYEEIGMMLPIETEYDTEHNLVTADIDGEGTYCIMDMEIWFDIFELDPEELKTSASENAPMSYPLETKKKASADNEKIKTPIDIVFIMSTGGSTYYRQEVFDIEQNIMKNVADYCYKNFNDVEIYIVEYKKESANILRARKNVDFLANPASFSVGVSQMKLTSVPNEEYCESKYAFREISKIKFRENTNRYFYQFALSPFNYSEGEDGITLCEKGIGIFSQIIPPYLEFNNLEYQEKLHNAITNNNGLDIPLYSTANTTEAIIKHINSNLNTDLTPTTYHAMLANDLSKIRLDAPLKKGSTINSDSDDLTDLEEVKTEFLQYDSDGYAVLPTVKDIVSKLNSPIILSKDGNKDLLKCSMFAKVLELRILPCKSNPANYDSDYDGIKDGDDLNPYEKIDHLFVTARFDNEPESIYPKNKIVSKNRLDVIHDSAGPFAPVDTKGMSLKNYLLFMNSDLSDISNDTESADIDDRIRRRVLSFGSLLADTTPIPGMYYSTKRNGYKMPNAAKFMRRYIQNSGEDLVFEADEPIACTFEGRRPFYYLMNRVIDASEDTLADGATLCIATRGDRSEYSKEEVDSLYVDFYNHVNNPMEFDWMFSIGKGTSGVIAEVTRNGDEYTMRFKYCFFDLYDWDQNEESELYKLNSKGLAKCFRSIGVYEDSFRWIKGNRFPPLEPSSRIDSIESLEELYTHKYLVESLLSLDHIENTYLMKKMSDKRAFLRFID